MSKSEVCTTLVLGMAGIPIGGLDSVRARKMHAGDLVLKAKPGDHIARRSSGQHIVHHGVFVGIKDEAAYVIDANPASAPSLFGSGEPMVIRRRTVGDFLGGADIGMIFDYPTLDSGEVRAACLARATQAAEGRRRDAELYHILGNNCEHFAVWARTGRCVPVDFGALLAAVPDPPRSTVLKR